MAEHAGHLHQLDLSLRLGGFEYQRGGAPVTIISGTNGFSVGPNAGQQQTNGTNYILLYFTPGTNSTITEPCTNTIQVALTNVTGPEPWGGATNNIEIVVAPPQPGPPYLQVRFYNSSTNPPDQVYILPASTTYGAAGFGNGFWWSNSNGVNTWTNWIATSNQWTARLSDIGVSGTNAEGNAYYAINTTNFPNAAWYLSYGGSAVSSTNNARPAANATNSICPGMGADPPVGETRSH